MQLSPSSLRSPARSGALALGGLLALVALDAAPALGEPTPIGSPHFDWLFQPLMYDSSNEPQYEFADRLESFQVGGEVHDTYEALLFPNSVPDGEVFSNAGATTFWASSVAPFGTGDPVEGDPVGTWVGLSFRQSFRKDQANASLAYKLTDIRLIGADPSAPGDGRGPGGSLEVDVYIFKERDPNGLILSEFWDWVSIDGLGGGAGWELDGLGGGGPLALPVAPRAGGLDQSYVELALTQPFTVPIDLSGVLQGEEFTLAYYLKAVAFDTAQTDTFMAVHGRDPADPDSGSYFEYTGLTPTDNPLVVPEPGRPALLLAGGALLLCLRRRSRRSGARVAGALAGLRAFPVTRS